MSDFLKMAHNELWEFLSAQDNPLKNYLRLQKNGADVYVECPGIPAEFLREKNLPQGERYTCQQVKQKKKGLRYDP
jgi:hypothetical protein